MNARGNRMMGDMAISSKKKKEKMEEEIASNRERDLAVKKMTAAVSNKLIKEGGCRVIKSVGALSSHHS